MRPTRLIFALVALATIGLLVSPTFSQEDQEGPSRRDVLQYVWDFVVIGDADATADDLRNIASHYGQVPETTRTKIEQTVGSRALSGRQKRQAVQALIPNCRYGTVTTTAGESHLGVLQFEWWDGRRYKALDVLHLKLTKGGRTSIPWCDLVDIQSGEDVLTVKTNSGRLLVGTAEFYVSVHAAGMEPVRIGMG